MGSRRCTSGCAWGDTWPWGRGCALRVSFPASGSTVQRRGRGGERSSELKCRAPHLVRTGLRARRSSTGSVGHPSTLSPDPGALELTCPGGRSTARCSRTLGAELGELGGKEGRTRGGLTYLPQLPLPRCSRGVPVHSNQQRQLGFAKFGLAPPEKRREPAKERRAQFLEKGPPELGKGNAMNSAKEFNI